MITIESISIQNFMSFKSAVIKLKPNGLYFISGMNEMGDDSNGAGKSAIMSAICWAIFGRTQKGLTGTDVKRWGSEKDPTVVLLSLRDGDTVYSIVRSIGALSYAINGEGVSGGKTEIQNKILKDLNTDFSTFISTNMFTRGQVDFLADSGDASKKKLFKSVLRLEKLDEGYKVCKFHVKEHEKNADNISSDIKHLEDLLQKAQRDVERYIVMAERDEEERKNKVEEIRKGIDSIGEVEQPPFTVEDVQKLEDKVSNTRLQRLDELLEQLFKDERAWEREVARKELEAQVLKEQIDKVDVGNSECPTCGSHLDKDNEGFMRHWKELNASLHAVTDICKVNKLKLKKIKENILQIQDRLMNHAQDVNELRDKKKDLEIYEIGRKNVEVIKANIEKSIQDVINAPKVYEQFAENSRKEVQKLSTQLADSAVILKNNTELIDYFSYLSWLFSRQGVVGYIIDRSFKRLETLTNRYLKNIAKEGFSIEIKPQRELKSGEFKDEIDIPVLLGGMRVKYDNLSSGQQQRINIALLMAIYMWSREVGANPFNFMLLDEVLDLSLAERGQEDVCDFISTMLKDIGQIFVISHRDGLQSHSYNEIHVVRDKKGVSSI